MNPKPIYRKYDETFKREAVNLVLEQGYSSVLGAKALGIAVSTL